MAGLIIVTWNVENFSSEAEHFEAKLGYLVARLRQMNADVVALQEVLDERAAKQLAAQLSCEVTLGFPDARGNRVGFLTRATPARVQVLSDWRLADGVLVQELGADGRVVQLSQLSRPALKITVEHDDEEIDVVNLHLKSKLLTFPGGRFSPEDESERARVAYFALQRRAAEATTIREHVNELLARERNVVVLGDLNDGPHAATTEVLYGPIGSQARGPEDATNRNSGFNKKDSGDGERLFNVTSLVEQTKRWSRRYAGQNELIDHILISASLMLPRRDGLFQVPEVVIHNADAPMRTDDPVTDGVEPDHAAVVATFE